MADGVNWGSVADWAAAVASGAASIVALYLAREATSIKWEGFSGLRMIVGDGQEDHPEVVAVHVTNTGTRPANVTTISIRTGFWKKRFAIIPVWDPGLSSPLPTVLQDGQRGHWMIALDGTPDWITQLCTGNDAFVRSWLDVRTFRFEVHASAGAKMSLRPEGPLRKRMDAARKGVSAPA